MEINLGLILFPIIFFQQSSIVSSVERGMRVTEGDWLIKHFSPARVLPNVGRNSRGRIGRSTVYNKGGKASPIRDKDGNLLILATKTYYAVINKNTGFVFGLNEKLDLWKVSHWMEFVDVESYGGTNFYQLGSDRVNEEGATIFTYWDVQVKRTDGNRFLVLGRSEDCVDKRPGQKYYSNRNDQIDRGFFCGLHEYGGSHGYEEDVFQYEFLPFTEYVKRFYDVNGIMADFRFKSLVGDILKSHKKQVSLIETHGISNCGGGEVSQMVTNSRRKTESNSIQTSKSVSSSSKFFNSFSMTFAFKPSITFMGFGASGPEFSFQTDFGWENTRTETLTEDKGMTATREVTYEIRKTVQVNPFSCVQVSGYTDWIEKLVMEYRATIRVKITSRTGWLLDKIKSEYILEKLGFDEEFSKVDEDGTLVYWTEGSLTASFGLKSVFTVLPVPPADCPCPPPGEE